MIMDDGGTEGRRKDDNLYIWDEKRRMVSSVYVGVINVLVLFLSALIGCLPLSPL